MEPVAIPSNQKPDNAWPWLLLIAITTSLLVPFLGKAYHVDDPLFLWTARQIQTHPLDFYGFTITWDQRAVPMHVEMQNPPLFAYYLAAVTALVGWSELAIHVALLPWACSRPPVLTPRGSILFQASPGELGRGAYAGVRGIRHAGDVDMMLLALGPGRFTFGSSGRIFADWTSCLLPHSSPAWRPSQSILAWLSCR
ncbi:MAG: hypothetical protein U1D30_25560 [Planctomycetota bacterium]